MVKVYEYLGKNGIRSFTFLVGPWFESFATVKGRKRVNLKKLLLKTKLRKRNPEDHYLNLKPDKELIIDMIVPLGKLRDDDVSRISREKRV